MIYSGIKKSSAGFSAMEILVAMTMIGGVFGVLFHFGRLNTARVSSESKQSCEQIARSTMDHLRSFGLDRAQAVVSLRNNQISYPPSATTGAIAWKDTWRLPAQTATLVVDRPGDVATSNAYQGTIGVMNALATMYNRDARFCTNTRGLPYNSGNLMIKGAITNASGVKDRFSASNTTLQIQAYDLERGQFGCPDSGFPASIFPVPAAIATTPSGAGVVSYPADVTSRYGFWVTVHTTYTDQGGTAGECSVSSLFQYPKKDVDTSSGLQINFAFSASGPSECQRPEPGGTLTIALPPEAQGKSWVLMCLDKSSANALTGQTCPGRVTSQLLGTANLGKWVRCETVTACGLSHSTATWNSTGTVLTMRWNRLRWGCSPSIQARMIDSARNTVDNRTYYSQTPAAILSAWLRGPDCRPVPCPPPQTGGGFYCPPAPRPVCVTPPTPPGGGDGGDGQDGSDGGGRGGDGDDG